MADMILRHHIVTRLRATAAALYAACRKMPDNRFNWAPAVEGHTGRTAEDQVRECAFLNEWAALAFTTRQANPPDNAAFGQRAKEHSGRSATQQWLIQSTDALADAIGAFSDEELLQPVMHPFTRETTTWAGLAETIIWNLSYHQGQVNYIHTLYGDTSFP